MHKACTVHMHDFELGPVEAGTSSKTQRRQRCYPLAPTLIVRQVEFGAWSRRIWPGSERRAMLSGRVERSAAIIQTGERDFCLIGEWDDMDAIFAARPTMIETLDRSREMLEDLGGDLGVTDPVSGEVVFEVHREMA